MGHFFVLQGTQDFYGIEHGYDYMRSRNDGRYDHQRVIGHVEHRRGMKIPCILADFEVDNTGHAAAPDRQVRVKDTLRKASSAARIENPHWGTWRDVGVRSGRSVFHQRLVVLGPVGRLGLANVNCAPDPLATPQDLPGCICECVIKQQDFGLRITHGVKVFLQRPANIQWNDLATGPWNRKIGLEVAVTVQCKHRNTCITVASKRPQGGSKPSYAVANFNVSFAAAITNRGGLRTRNLCGALDQMSQVGNG